MGPQCVRDSRKGNATVTQVKETETGLLVDIDRLDPFAGSGTTLIAAEQLGRRCVAIEIEPRYVQIAIDRWEAFTGQTAVAVNPGPSRRPGAPDAA